MKTRYKTLLFGILVFAAFAQTSCSDSSTKEIERLDWMVGKWESKDSNAYLCENWSKENGFTLKGNAFAIENGDTTFSEYASVIKKGDKVYYSVTVNNETTTDFMLIKNADTAIFENKKHDFPQRILYWHKGDSLFARTEGMVDGVYTKEDFNYKKSE